MLQFPYSYSECLRVASHEFGSETFNRMLARKGVLMPDGRRYKYLGISRG